MVSKISLISKTYTEDAIGQKIPTEVETEIFADVASISANEFAKAGELGFKPLFKFNVWQNEYSGQEILKYKGVKYSIYRTYNNQKGRTELYAQKDVGI